MENATRQTSNVNPEVDTPLSFLEMVQSTLWAAIGVQKRANRVRDFSRGKALHFILMGIGFTACYVCVMLTIVHIILNSSGA